MEIWFDLKLKKSDRWMLSVIIYPNSNFRFHRVKERIGLHIDPDSFKDEQMYVLTHERLSSISLYDCLVSADKWQIRKTYRLNG